MFHFAFDKVLLKNFTTTTTLFTRTQWISNKDTVDDFEWPLKVTSATENFFVANMSNNTAYVAPETD